MTDYTTPRFVEEGKVACLIDGQYGSTGKGALAAFLAIKGNTPDLALTNAAPNAGHTSIVHGHKFVTYHMPTFGVICQSSTIVLTSGCAIDVPMLAREMADLNIDAGRVCIHPMAAIIDPEDKQAEALGSGPANIASTQKGVGSAFARRIMRVGRVARDVPELQQMVENFYDLGDLNVLLRGGMSATLEIPQGRDLSLTGRFYPHCTSRNVSVAQGLSDARVSPRYLGKIAASFRTYPIRVGNLAGKSSGGFWDDQDETTWEAIGQTPEVTTVTQRVRRVFTWSQQQFEDAIREIRPDLTYLSFCDYLKPGELAPRIAAIRNSLSKSGLPGDIWCSFGPAVENVCHADEALESEAAGV